MRIDRRHMVALLGASAIAAGCGSDQEKPKPSIPAANAEAIEVRLDEVQRRFDSGTDENNPGACEDLEKDTFPAIRGLLKALPADVDPEVRDTLEAGMARLRELTRDGCSNIEPTQTETTPRETTPPHTETTPPETETTPPETETTPPPTTPPTTPQQPGGDGGTPVPEGDD